MKKLLVVGCSYAKGAGLLNEDKNESLWVNQLHQQCWPEHSLTNYSKIGANNQWIFFETMSALIKDHYDAVLIEWTAIPRYNLNIGLELYSTTSMLQPISPDVLINNGNVVSGKLLSKLGNEMRKLHNDHWSILDLIKYINVLIEIQTSRQGRIYFVNGLCPWSDQYFEKQDIWYPNELSTYEQELFSITTRDDIEIFKLYDKIHEEYNYYGGIQKKHWLNLYESLYTQAIDQASKIDSHPGLLSQAVFVELLKRNVN